MKKRFYTFTLGILATSIMFSMTGCGNGSTDVQSNAIEPMQSTKSEWYARVIAEIPSENMKDEGNVLGQLKDSSNAYDSHDLVEMSPFGSKYLTIVFPHTEWGERSGAYTSDYHSLNTDTNDEWVFQVITSAINSDVTLRWEGLYVLASEGIKEQLAKDEFFAKMWVEDTLTGEQIPVIVKGELQTYTFNMNGQNTREFRWGIGEYVQSESVNIVSTKKAKMTNGPMEAMDLVPGRPL